MNKTKSHIESKKNILSIYFTAEYPTKGSTIATIKSLANAGADLLEIGIPFSDPLADGPVIQKSSAKALENGFTLQQLFADLKTIHHGIKIPMVLMGYFNTVLAFGIENFLKQCQSIGIDTVILPDLPPEIYEQSYQKLFKKHQVSLVFLVTPQTSDERLAYINNLSESFIYAVADNSITGTKSGFSTQQLDYFKRIKNYKFNVPVIIGFGISDQQSFNEACKYANGAIIGSAFIKALDNTNINNSIQEFITSIREKH